MRNGALCNFHAAEDDFGNMCGMELYVVSMQPEGSYNFFCRMKVYEAFTLCRPTHSLGKTINKHVLCVKVVRKFVWNKY